MSYYKKHYEKNREKLIARSAETTRRKRAELREYLNGLKSEATCPDCGSRHPDHPWRMAFDHLPQYEKKCNIANLGSNGWGWKRIEEEIAKCEIVCLLCHADRTQARLGAMV